MHICLNSMIAGRSFYALVATNAVEIAYIQNSIPVNICGVCGETSLWVRFQTYCQKLCLFQLLSLSMGFRKFPSLLLFIFDVYHACVLPFSPGYTPFIFCKVDAYIKNILLTFCIYKILYFEFFIYFLPLISFIWELQILFIFKSVTLKPPFVVF